MEHVPFIVLPFDVVFYANEDMASHTLLAEIKMFYMLLNILFQSLGPVKEEVKHTKKLLHPFNRHTV